MENKKRETLGAPRAQEACVKSWKLRDQKHCESYRNARKTGLLTKRTAKAQGKREAATITKRAGIALAAKTMK